MRATRRVSVCGRGARTPRGLAAGRSHIGHSAPQPSDRPAVDFDAPGRLNLHAIEELRVPRDADFHPCGPFAFINDLAVELGTWGVAATASAVIFGSTPPKTPGIAAAPRGYRTSRPGPLAWAHRCPSRERPKRPLGPGPSELPRTCRGTPRASAVGMPHRRMPHLRDWAHQRRCRLPARARGAASRGQRADLPQPTSGRHRHRSSSESF